MECDNELVAPLDRHEAVNLDRLARGIDRTFVPNLATFVRGNTWDTTSSQAGFRLDASAASHGPDLHLQFLTAHCCTKIRRVYM